MCSPIKRSNGVHTSLMEPATDFTHYKKAPSRVGKYKLVVAPCAFRWHCEALDTKKGGATGRPKPQSSLLGDAGAKFFRCKKVFIRAHRDDSASRAIAGRKMRRMVG